MTEPSTPTVTTAQYLIAFRRELLEGGMPTEVTDGLVFEAARMTLNNDGLSVRKVGE